jgi:hypothetical protein
VRTSGRADLGFPMIGDFLPHEALRAADKGRGYFRYKIDGNFVACIPGSVIGMRNS